MNLIRHSKMNNNPLLVASLLASSFLFVACSSTEKKDSSYVKPHQQQPKTQTPKQSKAEKEKLEKAAKVLAAKIKAEKERVEKLEAKKAQQAKIKAEKAKKAKAAKAKLEKLKAEQALAAKRREDALKKEQAKAKLAKQKADKLAQEKKLAEEKEAQKLAALQLEADRLAKAHKELVPIKVSLDKLPIQIERWKLAQHPLKNEQCTLLSQTKLMNDGQGMTEVYIQVNNKDLLIFTKSNIDNSYTDAGVFINGEKVAVINTLYNETTAQFKDEAYKALIAKLPEANDLQIKFGFWPSWPVTKALAIEFDNTGFNSAYNALSDCNQLFN